MEEGLGGLLVKLGVKQGLIRHKKAEHRVCMSHTFKGIGYLMKVCKPYEGFKHTYCVCKLCRPHKHTISVYDQRKYSLRVSFDP